MDEKDVLQRIGDAARFIEEASPLRPKVGLILGSGLGALADGMEDKVVIPYGDIPHFPASTVVGHKGNLVVGKLAGTPAFAMQGRFHYYEGHAMADVVLPVRVMARLGVETFVVTNAAGGLNEKFEPGDLMLIRDHINMFGTNPLLGPNVDEFGPRFPDMTNAYDKDLRALAKDVAKELNIGLQEGVYMGLTGPTYETPAEIRAFRTLGADAVGMSTVPEVIVARHMGVKVLGISCISNMGAGMLPEPLSHEDVVAVTGRIAASFGRLVTTVVGRLGE